MAEYTIERLQGETLLDYKMRLCVAKLNKEHDLDWSEIINMLNLDCSSDSLRKRSYGYKEIYEEKQRLSVEEESEINYKETTEILKDGLQKSDKLIKMSAEESKSVDYLLKAHGFDPEEWELLTARNNIWNTNSKLQGVQTLYSSKISVKPKVNGFDMNKFIESVKREVKPVKIKEKTVNGEGLLEIPLFDTHFGVNTYDDYADVTEGIISKIRSKSWDKIIIINGGDSLHNNGFDGKTSSGTIIEKVDMVKAWDDAFRFFSEITSEALINSRSVEFHYCVSNHDDSMNYGLTKSLEVKFPEVEFDTGIEVRKGITWNDIFIGYSHGHKGNNRIHENFLTDFGKKMAVAKVVEIHCGHYHTEHARDKFGVLVRTLSTKGKTDGWHSQEGFIGAHKRFQLFEYTRDSLKAIYYI